MKLRVSPALRAIALTLGATGLVVLSLPGCTDGQAKVKPNYVFKDAPAPGVYARINGQDVTEEDLIGPELRVDYMEASRKQHDLLMEGLNRVIIDRLVGAEAKKAGMSTEEYIDKKIVGGKIKISDSDIKKFLAERRFPEAQITPEIKGRVTEFLSAQKKRDVLTAYSAELTKKTPVEVYFKKHKIKVNVEVGSSPTWGKADAPVTLIEFSDFQCPFCAQAASTVTELQKKYGPSKLRMAFKHLPLPNHPQARPASEAAACVAEQSGDKFWKFHELVFKNQSKLNNPAEDKSLGDKATIDGLMAKLAKEVGADMTKFAACWSAKKYSADIDKDLEYSRKLGIQSTPTFFINGQIVSGALPLEEFSALIDGELDDAKK